MRYIVKTNSLLAPPVWQPRTRLEKACQPIHVLLLMDSTVQHSPLFCIFLSNRQRLFLPTLLFPLSLSSVDSCGPHQPNFVRQPATKGYLVQRFRGPILLDIEVPAMAH